jgi:nicotinamidase-related amidase
MSDLTSSQSTSGPVLLCIDLQPVFLNTIPDRERLLKRCAFAIKAAQGLGITPVFTEQVPQKLGATDESLLGLVKSPHQLGKRSFSAMGDDGIRSTLLEQLGADHLIICGLETPVCVYQTAIDAIREDIPVTILTDCLGARRSDDAAAALAALSQAGAHVLPSETVFYSMLGNISHPYFKSFTQLVKQHA